MSYEIRAYIIALLSPKTEIFVEFNCVFFSENYDQFSVIDNILKPFFPPHLERTENCRKYYSLSYLKL